MDDRSHSHSHSHSPSQPAQVQIHLPQKVEEMIKRFCKEKHHDLPDASARKRLAEAGEEVAFDVVRKIFNSSQPITNLSGYITHLVKNSTSPSPSQSPLKRPLPSSRRASPVSASPAKRSLTISSYFPNSSAKTDESVTSTGNPISIESQDCSAPVSKDRLDMVKLTSGLLSQSERPEDFYLVATPPPTELRENLTDTNLPNLGFNVIRDISEEIATGHAEQKSRLSGCASLTLTEMAHMCNDIDDEEEVQSAIDPALVTVNGYRVKQEVATTLRAVFAKHGDIAGECTFENPKARAPILEIVCDICQELDKTTFGKITTDKINEMLDLIGDLERNKLNVGWLHQKLLAISQAKCRLRDYCGLKEEKTRNLEMIEKQEKELEKAKENLEATKAKVKEIDEKILDTKERATQLFKTEKSLAHGLL